MSEAAASWFTHRRAPGSDGVPVILLPGLFGGAWIWEETDCALAQAGYDTVTIPLAFAEMPPERGASIAGLRGMLEQLVTELGCREAVVCGNSLGGLVALDFACHHRDRVRSIVVSGAPGLGSTQLGIAVEWDVSDALAHSVASNIFHDPGRVSPEHVGMALGVLSSDDTKLNVLRALRDARRCDVAALLPRVDVPALLIWGEHDVVTPVAPWRDAVRSMPAAELQVVPDSGHSPMIETPGAFVERLLGFLAGGSAARPPSSAAAEA